jgi:ferrous iron transport protein B
MSDTKPKRVALVGNPNVGKSALFSKLTSQYATVSNFPGTTVDIFRGRTEVEGQTYEIIDTPGVQGLNASSEDERVTTEILQREKPDLVVQVADAKNLRRSLFLTSQLAALKLPLLLVLNMKDECAARGIRLNSKLLSQRLEVPVVETVAISGEGVLELRKLLNSGAVCALNGCPPSEWVEEKLLGVLSRAGGGQEQGRTSTRWFVGASVLGAAVHLENYLGQYLGWPSLYGTLENWLGVLNYSSVSGCLRSGLVIVFASLLPVLIPFLWGVHCDARFSEHFGIWSRRFVSGLVIVAVALSVIYQLVGRLGAQVLVALMERGLFERYITPALQGVIPAGFLQDLLVGRYGLISMGLTYGLAIVLPVVSTFFIAFSFLEDSGYLPRLAVLTDRFFRLMGLHGKAFLPIILGLGCVTMATLSTRILSSRKERLMASVLLVLAVPCSAQLGVILGIVSGISAPAVFLIFCTVIIQVFVVGLTMSKLLPGRRSDFILELPPIRPPLWRNVLGKTGLRVGWFLKEALPLFMLGTLALFVLDRLDLLRALVDTLHPVVEDLLGLPRQTAEVFLLGFLRRDYGAAGLFAMARDGLLRPRQIVVSLTVMTLFVPCLASFLVLVKEQGARNAVLILAFISSYAILVGSVLNFGLRALGLFS